MKKKEILELYNEKVVKAYLESRKKKSIYNDYIASPALRNLLKEEIKGKDVLDLGCGFGDDIIWCYDKGAKSATGIEINPLFIDVLKKEIKDRNIKIIEGDINEIKIDKKFDLIYSNMVFDQIKDLNKTFKKVNNMLNEKGKFIFVVSHSIIQRTNEYTKNMDGYFKIEKKYFSPASHGGGKIYIYCRNIDFYSELIFKSNFLIERILEPRPIKEAEKDFKKEFELFSNLPTILIFSLVKK